MTTKTPPPIDLSDQPLSVQRAFKEVTERADKAEARLAEQRTAHMASLLRSELAQLDIHGSAAAESAIKLIVSDARDLAIRTVNGRDELTGTLDGRQLHSTLGIAKSFIDANPHYTRSFHDAQHAEANKQALAKGVVPRDVTLADLPHDKLMAVVGAAQRRANPVPVPKPYDPRRFAGLAMHELSSDQLLQLNAENIRRGAA